MSKIKCKIFLFYNGEKLEEINIKRKFNKVNRCHHCSLFFVWSLYPIYTKIPVKQTKIQIENETYKFNHLFFMYDLKLYAKSQLEFDDLKSLTHYAFNSISMDLNINKCYDNKDIIVSNSGNKKRRIYKYLRILEMKLIIMKKIESQI